MTTDPIRIEGGELLHKPHVGWECDWVVRPAEHSGWYPVPTIVVAALRAERERAERVEGMLSEVARLRGGEPARPGMTVYAAGDGPGEFLTLTVAPFDEWEFDGEELLAWAYDDRNDEGRTTSACHATPDSAAEASWRCQI